MRQAAVVREARRIIRSRRAGHGLATGGCFEVVGDDDVRFSPVEQRSPAHLLGESPQRRHSTTRKFCWKSPQVAKASISLHTNAGKGAACISRRSRNAGQCSRTIATASHACVLRGTADAVYLTTWIALDPTSGRLLRLPK
jgi:hypothetical protein